MDASTVIQSRVIGARLVETNLISDEQLERALQLQEEKGHRLGQILAEEFGVSQLDFASVLAEHGVAEGEHGPTPELRIGAGGAQTEDPEEPLTPVNVRIRRPIGEIFVENGFITSAQLETALEVQQRTGARIGEILVEQGVLTRLDLASALAEHWEPPPAAPPPAVAVSPHPDQVPPTYDQDAVAHLELAVSRLEEAQAADTMAAEARIAGLEEAAKALAGLEERVRESVASALAAQGDGAPVSAEDLEAAAAATGALAEQVAELTASLDGVRAQVAAVASRPATDEPDERLTELSERIDRAVGEGQERIRFGRRLEELAGRLDGLVDRDEATALDGRVAELSAALEALRAQVADVTSRPESPDPGDQLVALSERIDRAAGEGQEKLLGLAEDLGRRLDEVAGRVDGLVGRDEAASVEERVAGLAEVLEELRAEIAAVAERPEAGDQEERLRELSERIDRAAGEGQEKLQGLAEDLGRRLEEISGRVSDVAGRDEAAAAEERVAGLAGVVAELRAEIAAVADRPEPIDTGARLLELSDLIDRAAKDKDEKIERLGQDLDRRLEEVAGRIDGLGERDGAAELQASVAELAGRIDGLAGRDEAAAVEERVTGLAGVLEELRAEIAAVADRPEPIDTGARLLELSDLIDRAAKDKDEKIERLGQDLDRRLEEVAGRIAGLVDRDEAVAASRADRADLEARTLTLDSQLRAQQAETAALRSLLDETLGASEGATEWQERLEGTLDERLAGLEGRLTVEAATARADIENAVDTLGGETGSLAARMDELFSLRHDDLQAARLTTEELVDRLTDLARTMSDAEARLSAREGLSAELEAMVTSMAMRLDQLEETAPPTDSDAVTGELADLESRIEALIAIGEEQARVTEREISKGLASLGKKVVGKKHSKKGKGRKGSIERLGAVVIEAGARLADQIPVAETEGCVVFAPTSEGYRLVELPGTPPEVGAKIKIKGCGGKLVVTRYGRSPLPFDARPCAYVDRV